VGWIRRYDMSSRSERATGLEFGESAIARGDLVVLPTDTVYGLGSDAFTPDAVAKLLRAKGRGRDLPVPVLVANPRVLDGIAANLTDVARDLVAGFWPGGLTVVAHVQPSLQWDLGETGGTVAVRMPLHPVALELLARTGPLAVSSANISGSAPATDVDQAIEMLGDKVAAYLDGGPSGDPVPSTIVDVTADPPRVLRVGDIPVEALREVASDLEVAP